MHVLFYINSLATGGAERTLVKLANALAASHDVTVVTQQSADMDRFTLLDHVTRLSTDSGATSTSVFSAVRNNWRRISRLRHLIKQRNPDVVVAFMATANTVATFAVQGLGIPVVVSERNYPPALPLAPLHRLAQRMANRRADHMVVLTEQTRQWYQSARGLSRLSVIANGVTYPIPESVPVVAPESCVSTQHKLLLCVGRISAQKQPGLALRTFAAVAPEFPEWKMVWVGRGDTQGLYDLAAELGIQSQFAAPGPVGNVQAWYERADVFLMTSAYEGFPNSLLEAMACGCACVALNCPTGPADILQHQVNGLLVELDQQDHLESALRQLLGQADLRARLAQAGIKVREQFSDAATHAAWRELLEQVVAATSAD